MGVHGVRRNSSGGEGWGGPKTVIWRVLCVPGVRRGRQQPLAAAKHVVPVGLIYAHAHFFLCHCAVCCVVVRHRASESGVDRAAVGVRRAACAVLVLVWCQLQHNVRMHSAQCTNKQIDSWAPTKRMTKVYCTLPMVFVSCPHELVANGAMHGAWAPI